jgi:hypothetical protein
MADKSPADIVREALDNLEQPTTPSEIVRWVRRKYPHLDEGKIRSQVTICCVNMPTRVSFPENQAPRLAKDRALDCMYRVDFGQYVKYDPALHGQWEIADADGELVVRLVPGQEEAPAVKAEAAPVVEAVPVDAPTTPEPSELRIHGKAKRVKTDKPEETLAPAESQPEPEPWPITVAAEEAVVPHATANIEQMSEGDAEMKPEQAAQLHEILADRLLEVEDGLKIHPDPGIVSGFPVPLSSNDILAEGHNGSIVIVKVFTQPPGNQFITDLLVDMGWAHENIQGREVRAIALMPSVPDELRFAAKTIPGIKLATFEYKLVFTPVK